jgi:hypothetical protein
VEAGGTERYGYRAIPDVDTPLEADLSYPRTTSVGHRYVLRDKPSALKRDWLSSWQDEMGDSGDILTLPTNSGLVLTDQGLRVKEVVTEDLLATVFA